MPQKNPDDSMKVGWLPPEQRVCYHSSMGLSKAIFAVLILVSLVMAATLGIYISMMTDGHGSMNPCPFGTASVCPMSIAQHITAWQSSFNATIPQKIVSLLALILLLVGFSSINAKGVFSATVEFSIIKRERLTSLFFNPLRLAFSGGILHPKIYSSSR